MSYTTVNDLPERDFSQLLGTENLLLTDPDNSYRVTIETVNAKILELSSASIQTMTNKVIDDVSNFVHANAIHYVAKPMQNISKGTPVNVVPNADTTSVYVDIASSAGTTVGVCEEDMVVGSLGSIMIAGVLSDFDTTTWVENDLLYSSGGVITNVQPTSDSIQFIGYVLNSATLGKILISAADPFPDARQILFSGVASNLESTNVQDAIIEVESRITDMEEVVFQQANAPTTEEGASDGDIWMDTIANTLNVYREYPVNTGVYRWEPLIYKLDDTVDGGSW